MSSGLRVRFGQDQDRAMSDAMRHLEEKDEEVVGIGSSGLAAHKTRWSKAGDKSGRHKGFSTPAYAMKAVRPSEIYHEGGSDFSSEASSSPAEDRPPTPVFAAPASSTVKVHQTDLYNRDRESIEYTKSLLNEGDTLVFIKYPGDIEVYDPTGNYLKPQSHRVHSGRLLATGSPKFTKLLTDDWKQHLMRKRNGFVNKEALPHGILYVLDLTPPDEGDEAVDLISALSCSVGIRNWYSSSQRCGVHQDIVGGRDDTTMPKSSIGVIQAQSIEEAIETEASSTIPCKEPDESTHRAQSIDEENLHRAIARSREDQRLHELQQNQYDPASKFGMEVKIARSKVDEYCPIRHRAAIQALLQIIEGKNPKVDSAPKMWTLVGVAQYFACSHVVVDLVLSWMLAEPNTQFFETLPEASFTIGKILQSAVIARPAFAILVSEEALSLAARMASSEAPTARRLARDKSLSRFRRPQEDLDEDSLTSVQAAATDFQSRVQHAVDKLMLDTEMRWLSEQIPEYVELLNLHTKLPNADGDLGMRARLVAAELADCLRNYVRAKLLAVLTMPIPEEIVTAVNKNRKAEQYLQEWPGDFSDLYDSLSVGEKIMTTVFWGMIRKVPWSVRHDSNFLFTAIGSTERSRNAKLIEDYELKRVDMHVLLCLEDNLNNVIQAAHRTPDGGHDQRASMILAAATFPEKQMFSDPNMSTEAASLIDVKSARSRQYIRDQAQGDPLLKALDEVLAIQADTMNLKSKAMPDEQVEPCLDEVKGEAPSVDTLASAELDHAIRDGPDGLPDTKRFEVPIHLLNTSSESQKYSWSDPLRYSSRQMNEDLSTVQKKRKISLETDDDVSNQYRQDLFRTDNKDSNFTLSPISNKTVRSLIWDTDDEELDAAQPPKQDYFQFRLKYFLTQVRDHVSRVVGNMISTSEIDFNIKLTDTILSLNHNEYKYLPLWAGGDDDGTGGVFDPSLPPDTMGPIGPGPAYHTGFSVNSQASSEMEWDGNSVDTSVAVENGFSDHIDRRFVQSDDGFRSSTTGSVAFSYDSEDYDAVKDKGKGKAVDRNIEALGDVKEYAKAIDKDSTALEKLDEVEDVDMSDDGEDFAGFSDDDDESWVDDYGTI